MVLTISRRYWRRTSKIKQGQPDHKISVNIHSAAPYWTFVIEGLHKGGAPRDVCSDRHSIRTCGSPCLLPVACTSPCLLVHLAEQNVCVVPRPAVFISIRGSSQLVHLTFLRFARWLALEGSLTVVGTRVGILFASGRCRSPR